MIDVDARGRYEAELLRDEAVRIADTEAALRSVLDGEVVVPLETRRGASTGPALARRPVPARRWIAITAGVAAAAVAMFLVGRSYDPDVVPPTDTTVTASTELAVRPLDPPIRCEQDRCPSLAVMQPEGILVAYDEAANTLVNYKADRLVRHVAVDFDAEHVELVAVDCCGAFYFLAGSPERESWELIAVDGSEEVARRPAGATPHIELSDAGLREHCWSGCEPAAPPFMSWVHPTGVNYPDVTHDSGMITVRRGEREWSIAWPHTLSTRSRSAPRWDGGAVLTLIPESAEIPSELIELLPDGTVEHFAIDDVVHALLPDGSAVVWRDGQLVRLSPPRRAEPTGPWSPELQARTLDPPITCFRSASATGCPQLAVAPDGTLVEYDPEAATLTWYEDEPRIVPVTADLTGTDFDLTGPGWDFRPWLMAIGPHDVAYFQVSSPAQGEVIAIAPSGAEITRAAGSSSIEGPLMPTATGIVETRCRNSPANRCGGGPEWPPPEVTPVMPWVDADGRPITDPRRYPTARDTDAGVEVRLGERAWLLTQEMLDGHQFPTVTPRSDGGVVMLHDETADAPRQPRKLIEMLPDGTIERYVVPWPTTVLPDGSVIVEQNYQLIRLTPPA